MQILAFDDLRNFVVQKPSWRKKESSDQYILKSRQLHFKIHENTFQLEKEESFYSGRLNNDQLLETLTSYDTRILIRTEDELARSDGFSGIFPDKNCTRWQESIFFSQVLTFFSGCSTSLTSICTGEEIFIQPTF